MKRTVFFFLFAFIFISPKVLLAQPTIQVATGNNHVLAIKDGRLYGWGDNSEGQLGIGTKSIEYAPVQIGNSNDWKNVYAAAMHSMAIKKDGSLWAWGWGNNHELGLGQANSRSLVPERVGQDTNWAMITTAANNTIGIKTNGSLWIWGSNVGAALGVGPTTNSAVYAPTRVGKENDWITATAGQHMLLAIKKNGTLWSWGRKGGSDIRGNAPSGDITLTPMQVGTGNNWKKLFVHPQHGRAAVIALRQDGSVWAWGNNAAGKLGFGDMETRQQPAPVPVKGEWQSFAIATEYTLGVHADGSLWHSGNYLKWIDARIGEQNKSTTFQQTKIPGKWSAVHMLQISGVVLIDDKGNIFTYGINARGELGNGTKAGSWKPTLVKL